MTPTERLIADEYDALPTDYRADVYVPGMARMGEATPQTNPALFTGAEITAEIKYLIRMNKRIGPHVLRTLAYQRLALVLQERNATLRTLR